MLVSFSYSGHGLVRESSCHNRFLDAAGEVAEQKVETRKTKKKTKAELLQMKKDNQKLAQEEQRRKNAKNRIQNELDRKALIETHSFAALVRSL